MIESSQLVDILRKDMNRMSTEDLVLCWSFLYRIRRRARREKNPGLVELCAERMLLIDGEIGSRQLQIEDELRFLRAQNAAESNG